MKKGKLNILLAYHEAGHAVTATVLGLAVHYATIKPTETTIGYCQCDGTKTPATACLIAAAGDVSVHTHSPDELPEMSRMLAERHRQLRRGAVAAHGDDPDASKTPSDNEAIAANLAHFGIPMDADSLAAVYGQCRALLKSHWRAVQIVAEELLIFGTVSGERVAEIVSGHDSPTNPYSGKRRQEIVMKFLDALRTKQAKQEQTDLGRYAEILKEAAAKGGELSPARQKELESVSNALGFNVERIEKDAALFVEQLDLAAKGDGLDAIQAELKKTRELHAQAQIDLESATKQGHRKCGELRDKIHSLQVRNTECLRSQSRLEEIEAELRRMFG